MQMAGMGYSPHPVMPTRNIFDKNLKISLKEKDSILAEW